MAKLSKNAPKAAIAESKLLQESKKRKRQIEEEEEEEEEGVDSYASDEEDDEGGDANTAAVEDDNEEASECDEDGDNDVSGEESYDVDGMDEEDEEEEKERLKKEALAYRESLERRGVIYMSRVPPFMKPNKVRTLLEEYGEITRLFLAEEDAQIRKKRKERGGNGSKQFREGWIEFADKKVAKKVATSLNNTAIGGRKSDYYHDDIWNLKYLKNFKWEYLTEKLAYERRVREMKMKAALAQSKKTNAEMKQLIEKTKVQEIIQHRKKSKPGDQSNGEDAPRQNVDSNRIMRKFKQHKVIAKDYDTNDNRVDNKLLKSIFNEKK